MSAAMVSATVAIIATQHPPGNPVPLHIMLAFLAFLGFFMGFMGCMHSPRDWKSWAYGVVWGVLTPSLVLMFLCAVELTMRLIS